jgi:hypothetical protein
MAAKPANDDPRLQFDLSRRARAANDAVWQHGAKYGHDGATLLEFAVSATVLGVIAVIFLGRLLTAEEHAEKAAMELSISHMRAGLRAQVGALLMADRASEIAALAGGDPTDWLDSRPENYLGAFRDQPPGDVAGTWYFDATRRELVYTANSRRHFVPSASDGYTVRVKIVPLPRSTDSVAAGDEPGWVQLAIVNEYRWF